MAAYPAREQRQPVKIGARLKSGRGWNDVVIRNVSSRGIMGLCSAPPARGDYVEVRCGAYVIVARVAWSGGACFGARSQDRIALPELIACGEGRGAPVPDRRQQARPSPKPAFAPSLAAREAASARLARSLDFVAIALAGATFASVVSGVAHQAMAVPAAEIAGAFEGGRQ